MLRTAVFLSYLPRRIPELSAGQIGKIADLHAQGLFRVSSLRVRQGGCTLIEMQEPLKAGANLNSHWLSLWAKPGMVFLNDAGESSNRAALATFFRPRFG
ncbi:MAG: hypothetical protein PHG00_07485 [Methylococcales bacterium]|nr:hypothetical protein [Methylococcales bacterium]